MPLAFGNSALARIAIAATRIPVHARGRWLQQLAAQLDLPKCSVLATDVNPRLWLSTIFPARLVWL